jgi:hypothetical protein
MKAGAISLNTVNRKSVVAAALVGASVCGLFTFGSTPATAAPFGQAEVAICNTNSSRLADKITVTGYNQDGRLTVWGPYSIRSNTCGQTRGYLWGKGGYVYIDYVMGGVQQPKKECLVSRDAGSVQTCYIW